MKLKPATFWVPNEVFDPTWELDPPEVVVYVLLCRQARGADGRSKQSLKLLAERSRLSPRRVEDALKRLSALTMIEVLPGGGRGKVNGYRVLPAAQWTVPGTETPQQVRGIEAWETPQDSTGNPAKSGSETPQLVRPEGDTAVREIQLEGVMPVAGAPGPLAQSLTQFLEAMPRRLQRPSSPLNRDAVTAIEQELLNNDTTGKLTQAKARRLAEAELARQEWEVLMARILAARRDRWEEAELAQLKAAGETPRDDKWKAKYQEAGAPDTSTLPELPEGWCWTSVEQLASDVARSIQSGPFGSNLRHSEFQDEGILVVGIDNVQDGYFSMGAEHRISEEKFKELEHYRARAGDALVTVMATVGRTCVVPDGLEPAIITKHVYRITPNRDVVEPRYLHLALWGGPAVLEQMFRQVIGQTRPGLNGEIIRDLAIPVPPIEEQVRVVEEADRLLSSRDQTFAQLSTSSLRAQRLRQAILKLAFEGKLVDQDPKDEPAEWLLARIRAERAADASTNKGRGSNAKRTV